MRTLTPDEAKAFYDKFGAKQDSQAFYESRALDALVAHGNFGEAGAVFELGCGTGRFALELLQHHLRPDAVYRGTDLSSTMVRIAAERLASFQSRASVSLAAADAAFPLPDASQDRFVSTYVLDLLSEPAAHGVIAEARRTLRAGGLLCMAGVTFGTTPVSRIVVGTWRWLFARNPAWVGGCRPTRLADSLAPSEWEIRFHDTVTSWGVASEVVVAARRSAPADADVKLRHVTTK